MWHYLDLWPKVTMEETCQTPPDDSFSERGVTLRSRLLTGQHTKACAKLQWCAPVFVDLVGFKQNVLISIYTFSLFYVLVRVSGQNLWEKSKVAIIFKMKKIRLNIATSPTLFCQEKERQKIKTTPGKRQLFFFLELFYFISSTCFLCCLGLYPTSGLVLITAHRMTKYKALQDLANIPVFD